MKSHYEPMMAEYVQRSPQNMEADGDTSAPRMAKTVQLNFTKDFTGSIGEVPVVEEPVEDMDTMVEDDNGEEMLPEEMKEPVPTIAVPEVQKKKTIKVEGNLNAPNIMIHPWVLDVARSIMNIKNAILKNFGIDIDADLALSIGRNPNAQVVANPRTGQLFLNPLFLLPISKYGNSAYNKAAGGVQLSGLIPNINIDLSKLTEIGIPDEQEPEHGTESIENEDNAEEEETDGEIGAAPPLNTENDKENGGSQEGSHKHKHTHGKNPENVVVVDGDGNSISVNSGLSDSDVRAGHSSQNAIVVDPRSGQLLLKKTGLKIAKGLIPLVVIPNLKNGTKSLNISTNLGDLAGEKIDALSRIPGAIADALSKFPTFLVSQIPNFNANLALNHPNLQTSVIASKDDKELKFEQSRNFEALGIKQDISKNLRVGLSNDQNRRRKSNEILVDTRTGQLFLGHLAAKAIKAKIFSKKEAAGAFLGRPLGVALANANNLLGLDLIPVPIKPAKPSGGISAATNIDITLVDPRDGQTIPPAVLGAAIKVISTGVGGLGPYAAIGGAIAGGTVGTVVGAGGLLRGIYRGVNEGIDSVVQDPEPEPTEPIISVPDIERQGQVLLKKAAIGGSLVGVPLALKANGAQPLINVFNAGAGALNNAINTGANVINSAINTKRNAINNAFKTAAGIPLAFLQSLPDVEVDIKHQLFVDGNGNVIRLNTGLEGSKLQVDTRTGQLLLVKPAVVKAVVGGANTVASNAGINVEKKLVVDGNGNLLQVDANLNAQGGKGSLVGVPSALGVQPLINAFNTGASVVTNAINTGANAINNAINSKGNTIKNILNGNSGINVQKKLVVDGNGNLLQVNADLDAQARVGQVLDNDGRYQLFGESLQIPNLQLGGNTQNVPQVHVQTPHVHLDQNGYGLGLGTPIQIPTTSIQIPSVPTIQIPTTPIQIPHVHVEVPKVVEIPQVQIQTPQIQVGQNDYSVGVVGTPIQIPQVHIEVPKVVEIPQVHIQTPQVQVGNIPVGTPVEIPQAQVEGNENLVKVNTGVHNTQLPVGNLVDLNTAFGGAQLLIDGDGNLADVNTGLLDSEIQDNGYLGLSLGELNHETPLNVPQLQVGGDANLVKLNTGVHKSLLPVGDLADLNAALGTGAQLLIDGNGNLVDVNTGLSESQVEGVEAPEIVIPPVQIQIPHVQVGLNDYPLELVNILPAVQPVPHVPIVDEANDRSGQSYRRARRPRY